MALPADISAPRRAARSLALSGGARGFRGGHGGAVGGAGAPGAARPAGLDRRRGDAGRAHYPARRPERAAHRFARRVRTPMARAPPGCRRGPRRVPRGEAASRAALSAGPPRRRALAQHRRRRGNRSGALRGEPRRVRLGELGGVSPTRAADPGDGRAGRGAVGDDAQPLCLPPVARRAGGRGEPITGGGGAVCRLLSVVGLAPP